MASRSNIHCCVPLCTQRGTLGPNWEKVGFFSFPKDELLKKVWLTKIRRDPGKDFNLNDNTKVCSVHFEPGEIKKGYGGKMSLIRRHEVFPTKFSWRTSPRKRPAPFLRKDPLKGNCRRKCLFSLKCLKSQLNHHKSIKNQKKRGLGSFFGGFLA